MKLISVYVENYRNLGNLTFAFNEDLNFIIGENNLGKSNFIDLLEILFTHTRFQADDFFDVDKEIYIDFQMKLNESEKKLFATRDDFLCIVATQKTADSNIQYLNSKTNLEIPVEDIRCVNFFRDGSIPGQGLSFTFSQTPNFVKIQEHYRKEYGDISALERSKKFLLAIEFLILEKIFSMSKTRQEKIKNAYYNKASKKTKQKSKKNSLKHYQLPIILAFDELEMHLNPYMQRSLVRALSKIINNENNFFFAVLKKEFGIEKLSGQVFIVTHSPNILLNNYKQFIRFYKKNSVGSVICGEKINVKNDKHLLKNFIYFKEAFFARFVIVVEGDSEFAAIPEFASKILNGNGLDSYGVSVIKADGKTSVNLIMNILQAFKINNLGLVDRDDDDFSKIQSRLQHPPYLYTTYFRDFEEELLEKIGYENYTILDTFLFSTENDKRLTFNRTFRDEQLCRKKIEKYSLDFKVDKNLKSDEDYFSMYNTNENAMKLFYLSELNRRKGISFWHEVGFELPITFIPEIYKKIILEAVSGQ